MMVLKYVRGKIMVSEMGLRKIMVSEMGLVENMVNMVSEKLRKKVGKTF